VAGGEPKGGKKARERMQVGLLSRTVKGGLRDDKELWGARNVQKLRMKGDSKGETISRRKDRRKEESGTRRKF